MCSGLSFLHIKFSVFLRDIINSTSTTGRYKSRQLMRMNKFMKTAHLALPAHLAASLSALSSFSRAQGMGLKGDEDWELKIENNDNNIL